MAYIVIMAGGGGTRLWPLSRDRMPKQFACLHGTQTLLQHTFMRAKAFVRDSKRILVTTRKEYVREIRAQLPKVPQENILVEPIKRDTAPSIGMAAAFLASQGKHDESIIMMPSDHYIRREPIFHQSLREVETILRKKEKATVLLGDVPTYPETGYGYIELGDILHKKSALSVCRVKRFREKPSKRQAQQFLRSENFVWNMGVYGWRVDTLLRLYRDTAPMISRNLDTLEAIFKSGGSEKRIASVYRRMPSISVDYAITEQQDPAHVFTITGKYQWSDIGHWGALEEILGNEVAAQCGPIVEMHAKNNFVHNTTKKAIGLVGVKNLVVVATDDAILVCDKAHVQDVKGLVEKFSKSSTKNKRYI